jgi:hypothetical protein
LTVGLWVWRWREILTAGREYNGELKYYFRPVQYLTIWDLVLTPVYLGVLIFIAKSYRDKKYPPGHPLRRYYLPGLYVKFGGAIFIALIYQYYYHGGDTYNFFYHSQVINSSLNESFSSWFNLLLNRSPDNHPEIYKYTSEMFWYSDQSSYTVASIGAVLGLFNGTTYIPTALLFAFFSYTGIWAMYRTFANLYPRYHLALAIAFLFIPSTVVWGSAVFKDTVCMFSLGWLTYSTFQIFVNRNFSIGNFIILVVSFYFLAVIKIYIVLAFLPALSLWLLMNYSGRVRSVAGRWILNLLFLAIVTSGFFFFAEQFNKELKGYSLERIAEKARVTQGWISYVSENQEGSSYDIGDLDGSFGSMLEKFPQAVNVTLYRPYLWESRKPIILLSALEAFAFAILTLLVFYRTGFFKTFQKIFSDANLLFFFVFTIIFAFAVGISTGNFGSLSRYKIPCMPFFAALLLILYFQTKTVTSTGQKKLTHAQRPVRHFA